MKRSLPLHFFLLGIGFFLIVLANQSPPGFEAGVQFFKEGHYQKAFQEFQLKDRTLGDRAPAALLFNRALAALQLQKALDAEISAERAAARGGPPAYPLRDFILGNAAFQRAEHAASESLLPEGGPRALERAILYLRRAMRHWKDALNHNPHWSQAQHNIALAKKRLQALQQRAQQNPKTIRKTKAPKKGTPTLAKLPPRPAPLSLPPLQSGQIQTLLKTLAKKEKEKWTLRRKKRQQRPTISGRSW